MTSGRRCGALALHIEIAENASPAVEGTNFDGDAR
jgi:hypothetical protein